jgi:hypothetical protein
MWYAEVLEYLYRYPSPSRNAGIATLMISLPLLERYLRQKNGLRPEQPIDGRCMATLRSVFRVFPDDATAWNFWRVYRNGFLHQVTLSLKSGGGSPLPAGSLTHDVTVPVTVEADGSFVLQPELFSRQVVQTIEADFNTFADVGTSAPSLPQLVAIVPPASGINVPPVTLSTRS